MNQRSRYLSLWIATFNNAVSPINDRHGLIERSRDCAAFRSAIVLFACRADHGLGAVVVPRPGHQQFPDHSENDGPQKQTGNAVGNGAPDHSD
jgi:hypothetical protein